MGITAKVMMNARRHNINSATMQKKATLKLKKDFI
jgi:hypothetical protein